MVCDCAGVDKLLGHSVDCRKYKWKEWHLQAWCCTNLHRLGYVFAGDMNAGKRGLGEQGRAKATGIAKGEPDLRVYMDGGRLLLVELKRKGGKLSPVQIERGEALRRLGFDMVVVVGNTPHGAWLELKKALEGF